MGCASSATLAVKKAMVLVPAVLPAVLAPEASEAAGKMKNNNSHAATIAGFKENENRGKFRTSKIQLFNTKNPQEFVKLLDIPADTMLCALTHFKPLERKKQQDGTLNRQDVAFALGMSPEDEHLRLIMNLMDMDRDSVITFKEYMIAASQLSGKDLGTPDRIRFCFMMVDDDNNGIATAAEIREFLGNCEIGGKGLSESDKETARLKVQLKVDEMMETMGFVDKVSKKVLINFVDEDGFVDLVQNHRKLFRMMLELYSKLRALFLGTMQKQGKEEAYLDSLDVYFQTDEDFMEEWPEGTVTGPKKAEGSKKSPGDKSSHGGRRKKGGGRGREESDESEMDISAKGKKDGSTENGDAERSEERKKKKSKYRSTPAGMVGSGLGKILLGESDNTEESSDDDHLLGKDELTMTKAEKDLIAKKLKYEQELAVMATPPPPTAGRRGAPRVPPPQPSPQTPNLERRGTVVEVGSLGSFGITTAQRRNSVA